MTHLPLSEFLDSLLCILIAPTPGLAFSLLMPHTLAVVSSFLSDRAELSTSSLSLLDPYSDYVGVNISFNNSSSLSFLNVYTPTMCLSHAKAPSSLWHGFSSSYLQSLLVFAFLSFHLEDIVYYSIHKMGKPLDCSASFRPISLTSCVSKLFEHMILSHLLFFLESNSILFPRQAGFHPRRSTLDQFLYLSQSILDGFNKPRSGSWMILSTHDFSKAFNSVWHPTLFHKLISAGLAPCFARWTESFLSDRCACVIYQNHKSHFFRVRRSVLQGSVLGPVLFSLFSNDLPVSLPTSISCSLYADDLAVWSSSPSVPTVVEATQGALFRLER